MARPPSAPSNNHPPVGVQRLEPSSITLAHYNKRYSSVKRGERSIIHQKGHQRFAENKSAEVDMAKGRSYHRHITTQI